MVVLLVTSSQVYQPDRSGPTGKFLDRPHHRLLIDLVHLDGRSGFGNKCDRELSAEMFSEFLETLEKNSGAEHLWMKDGKSESFEQRDRSFD